MFGIFKKRQNVIPPDIQEKCNAFIPEILKIVKDTNRPGILESVGPYKKEQVLTVIDSVSVFLSYGKWDLAIRELEEGIENIDLTKDLSHIDKPKEYLMNLLSRMKTYKPKVT